MPGTHQRLFVIYILDVLSYFHKSYGSELIILEWVLRWGNDNDIAQFPLITVTAQPVAVQFPRSHHVVSLLVHASQHKGWIRAGGGGGGWVMMSGWLTCTMGSYVMFCSTMFWSSTGHSPMVSSGTPWYHSIWYHSRLQSWLLCINLPWSVLLLQLLFLFQFLLLPCRLHSRRLVSLLVIQLQGHCLLDHQSGKIVVCCPSPTLMTRWDHPGLGIEGAGVPGRKGIIRVPYLPIKLRRVEARGDLNTQNWWIYQCFLPVMPFRDPVRMWYFPSTVSVGESSWEDVKESKWERVVWGTQRLLQLAINHVS